MFDMSRQALKLFDSHFHIIDGHFPLVPNDGYIPDEFTCADYLSRMRGYLRIPVKVTSHSGERDQFAH